MLMKRNFIAAALPAAIIISYIVIQMFRLDAVTKIWVDEPWYSNTAYNVAQGTGFSNDLVGSGGGDEAFLYTLILSSTFKIFGVSLFSARFFSVILGALVILFIYLSVNEAAGVAPAAAASFAAVLNSSLFVIFRTVRPEAAGIMFLTASLYFLLRRRGFADIFISSIFAYCAFLSHPAYLAVPAGAGAAVLYNFISERKKGEIAAFASATLISAVIFIVFILFVKKQTPALFFADWSSRAQGADAGFLKALISKTAKFAGDYSLGVKRAFILFFEAAAAPLCFIFMRRDKRAAALSIFTMTFILFTFLFLSKISLRFFASVSIPVLMLTMIAAVKTVRVKKSAGIMLFSLILIYTLNSAAGIPYLFYRERSTASYSFIEHKLSHLSKEGSSCATLINFWFPLRKMNVYNEYTRWEYTEYSGYEDLFDKNPPDFIVFSDYLLEGTATTSGRKTDDYKTDILREYIDLLKTEASKLYTETDSFDATGYGKIRVFKKSN